jgi:hypothetical protein
MPNSAGRRIVLNRSRKDSKDDLRGAEDEAMSQAVEKVRQLCRSIQKATGKLEEVWFGNLLLGILNSALLDYYSVQIGARKSIYLAAWGRRNLLELKVITTYVLASEKNAIEFRNDLAIDAKEFYQALTKHHQATHKELLTTLTELSEDKYASGEEQIGEVLKQVLRRETERGPQTEATDSLAATYQQLVTDFGLKENAKPKRIGDIARRLKQEEGFDPMFKICSKIMHRTVFSIASTVTPGSLDAAIPLLSSSSACDLLSIYGSVEKHFKKRGIRPPEN